MSDFYELEETSPVVELEISEPQINIGGGIDEETVKNLIKQETTNLQPKVDESLPTESKEIVGAIKELYDREDKQGLTEEQVKKIVQETGFSGDYNDLANKPVIPSTEGLATEEYVDEKIGDINTALETILGV